MLHRLIIGRLPYFRMIGSSPDVACVVFSGRSLRLTIRSNNCSVVGLTRALVSIFWSDGVANVTNLGCGSRCLMV